MVVVVVVVVGPSLGPPSAEPPCAGRPPLRRTPTPPDRPKFRSLFFPLPLPFRYFPLSGCLFY